MNGEREKRGKEDAEMTGLTYALILYLLLGVALATVWLVQLSRQAVPLPAAGPWRQKTTGAEKAQRMARFLIPVLAACAASLGNCVFFLTGGYICLADILGAAMAEGLFSSLQVCVPLAAVVVCLMWFIRHRQMLYLVLAWLNVLPALLCLGVVLGT